MSPPLKTIFVGPFVHCKALDQLDICEDGAIGVDENGVIAFIERDVEGRDADPVAKKHGWVNPKVVKIYDTGFFFPGFIDTHIHASQYPNAGIFGKSTLLDWLNTYTFPLESSFQDLSRANHIYNRAISRTLSHGTTTAAYYATIHVPATNLLADLCQAKGQRAFIGRVCMNSDLSPEWYREESTEAGIKASRESIEYIQSIDPNHDLITPIITPRFAPSCTHDYLQELGRLQKETGYPCQTHIAENESECALVKELFPDSKNYADVYDSAGLLNDKTILAHAIHLSDVEIALVKDREAKISHCPASNTALTSGCATIRKYLNEGISVGLGTDISGGFSPSILEAIRQAVWVSRYVAMTTSDAAKLSTEECLYLATRGGAKVVGLEHKIGGFEVGMDWDAQMIKLDTVDRYSEGAGGHEGAVDIFGWESWENRVFKWVYNGNAGNTLAVWVKGRLVHSTSAYRP
ncbi:hypothetical protein EG327_009727 [Venturia inaequalis]|uniref:Guanine deaminase n=1 Tax=Venturia inaequalis TaxID=5025 RepID=A0A8H3ZAX6_VENIN|nr:hypothetical protein EG327_009727 [Venturia inaequalis]